MPVSVFSGIDDTFAPPHEMAGWRAYVSGTFLSRMFPGDHFYLEESPELVTQEINSCLYKDGSLRHYPTL